MRLFLIGFMAAGKTSVGRAIAEAQRRPFVDLDDAIGAMGEPAPALVARDEPEFRRREARALAEAIVDPELENAVIATGGGAAAHADNLGRMRAAGCVVALHVDVVEAKRRVAASDGPPRPLLANAEALAAKRAPIYRGAHAVVDTTERSIDDIAAGVERVAQSWERAHVLGATPTIVALGERSYPVTVEATVDPQLVRTHLAGATQLAVITDHNVAKSPAAKLWEALGVEPIAIEPGEASKTLATYEHLCDQLIARGIDRQSAIVAVGGGVVGDLAGFVAATLFRGIRVVQVPTTIVAMSDAAVGGKTAVDTAAGKNLLGAFWQPQLVACGLDALSTLPARERRAGFGELWKYALLDGSELWDRVAECAAWAAGPDGTPPPSALRDVIQRSIAYKAAVVGRDEREVAGHRALLNLGHTVGHAIETEHGLLHGEAVGLGLIAAARVSTEIAGAPPELADRIAEVLAATGLPCDLGPRLTPNVIDRIGVDKKRAGSAIRFIAVRGVGACEPIDIPFDQLRRILRSGLAT